MISFREVKISHQYYMRLVAWKRGECKGKKQKVNSLLQFLLLLLTMGYYAISHKLGVLKPPQFESKYK